jgi:hypothetical protein
MRHRWQKLRLHTRICRQCGAGKVNAFVDGAWVTTYHLPDGSSRELRRTPPCERGPKTDAYLAKYAAEIAAAAGATA